MPTDAPTATKVLRLRVRGGSVSSSRPFLWRSGKDLGGRACTAEARDLKAVVKCRADMEVGQSVGLFWTTFVWFQPVEWRRIVSESGWLARFLPPPPRRHIRRDSGISHANKKSLHVL